MDNIYNATERAWRELTAYPGPDYHKTSFRIGFEDGAGWKQEQENIRITNSQNSLRLLMGDLTIVYQSLSSTIGDTETITKLHSCIVWLNEFIKTGLTETGNNLTVRLQSGKINSDGNR